jgi:hypothetical protein
MCIKESLGITFAVCTICLTDDNSHFGLQMCPNSYSGSGWDVGKCIGWLVEIFTEPWLYTRFNGLNFLSHSLNPKMHPDNCQGPFLF